MKLHTTKEHKTLHKHKQELEKLVYEACGEVSMCWSEQPTGTFQIEEACRIAGKLVYDILKLSNKE